jgi:hypothetical protein
VRIRPADSWHGAAEGVPDRSEAAPPGELRDVEPPQATIPSFVEPPTAPIADADPLLRPPSSPTIGSGQAGEGSGGAGPDDTDPFDAPTVRAPRPRYEDAVDEEGDH